MKLSVIIPVYNTEATLDRCLQSIVGQTMRDFEVILVDDGSTDQSGDLCDVWASQDRRIRVVHQQNIGLSGARNSGLLTATGDFVTFVDSDDFVERSTYAKVLPLMESNDIVEFPFYWQYGRDDQRRHIFADTVYTTADDYWIKGKAYEHTYAWNKIYRRELFDDDTRFPVGKLFEDAWTLPLLLKKARRVATTSVGMYYYCHNEFGITACADGEALGMLLEAHVTAMRQNTNWLRDTRYYMHVLNIQLDVSRLTGSEPLLPPRKVNPLAIGLTPKLRFKSFLLNLTGLKTLCRLNRRLSNPR